MDAKKIVEAVLFSSPDPISISKISKMTKLSPKVVEDAIKELSMEYNSRDSSIEILELGRKYLMRVRPEYYPFIEKFAEKDMDRGTQRTLAVIALKQPILLSKLAKIRGNKCYAHVRNLEELGLIKSEKKGRSRVLTTTRYFAKYFGLKSSDPEEIRRMLSKRVDSSLQTWLGEVNSG
jgi:segregation and condensation protein B